MTISLDAALLVLKYTGSVVAGAYGVYATLTDFREEKDGKKVLSNKGRRGIGLFLFSIFLNVSADGFKDIKEHREANEEKVRRIKALEAERVTSDSLTKQLAQTETINKELNGARNDLRQTATTTSSVLGEARRATEGIRNSGRLMTSLVLKTARELEFANHRFKNLSLALFVEDDGIFALAKPENYTTLGKQLSKTRDDRCNVSDLKKPPRNEEECSAAQDSYNRWEASNALRRYLDPSGSLELEILGEFAGFTLDGSTTYCTMPTGELSDSSECFVFELVARNTNDKTELTYASALGSIMFDWNVVFRFAEKDGFEQVFSDRGIPGRDASFLVLFVEGCDNRDRLAKSQAPPSLANQLRSNVKFVVEVTGVDDPTSGDVTNRHELREFMRGEGTSARCVQTVYTDAPESLVPRIRGPRVPSKPTSR